MKKLLILLFIPFFSFGQARNDTPYELSLSIVSALKNQDVAKLLKYSSSSYENYKRGIYYHANDPRGNMPKFYHGDKEKFISDGLNAYSQLKDKKVASFKELLEFGKRGGVTWETVGMFGIYFNGEGLLNKSYFNDKKYPNFKNMPLTIRILDSNSGKFVILKTFCYNSPGGFVFTKFEYQSIDI